MGDWSERTLEGGCLCGATRYRVEGRLRPVIACHCGQCRKTSGHHGAATAVAREGFSLLSGEGAITWYPSSPGVRRGFCSVCGSNLFWDSEAKREICIMAGTLDQPTGLALESHIFVGEKADYYEVGDGLPQKEAR
jgi:hypothetical protein